MYKSAPRCCAGCYDNNAITIQRHRRAGGDAGEQEQRRQDRVIQERIGFQRRQQKPVYALEQNRQYQH